jgi:hypothetical protein
MSPLDAATARSSLAEAALEAATVALLLAIKHYAPGYAGTAAEAVRMRRFEAIAEAGRDEPFCSAWSSYMRARRQASKARTALHIARLDAERRSELRKPGPSIAGPLTVAEVLDGIQERRAA